MVNFVTVGCLESLLWRPGQKTISTMTSAKNTLKLTDQNPGRMDDLYENIADGLASHGYSVFDGFLSDDEVRTILALDTFRETSDYFKKAGIGNRARHQYNEAIRGDYIHWLDKNKVSGPLAAYLGRLRDLRLFLNRSLFLSLQDEEVHMTVYPAGAFYKRHLDQFREDDRRKLSVICYLNEDWHAEHGGQLRLYSPEGNIEILPLAGRLVCLRSDLIEHEVLPATRERLSLTGWMLDRLAI